MRRNRLPIFPLVSTRDDRIEAVVIERVEEFATELESGAISDLDLLIAERPHGRRPRFTIIAVRSCLSVPGCASHLRAHQQKRESCCEEPFCGHPELPKKSFELRVVFKLVNLGSASPSNEGLDQNSTRIRQETSLRTTASKFGKLQSIRSTSFVHDQRRDCSRKLLRAIKSSYIP